MHGDRLNERQLRFAQLVAKGWKLVDAYCEAYGREKDAATRGNSSKLAAHPLVKKQIQEYKEIASQDFAEEMAWGLKEAMREANEAFELARSQQQPGSMKAATELKAKLKGLLVEKKAEEAPLPPAELDRRLADMLSQLPMELLFKAYQEQLARKEGAALKKSSTDIDASKFKAPSDPDHKPAKG